jgi:DNA polymerase III epsilon subunit-like protein
MTPSADSFAATTAGTDVFGKQVPDPANTSVKSRNLYEIQRRKEITMRPVFIDFEASSLSPKSWPIEVGIARVGGNEVIVESKLIRPHPSWAMAEWHAESAAVHGISLEELAGAEAAGDVARWLVDEVAGELLLSDAPEFDQRWCDRLLKLIGGSHDLRLTDFDQAVWWAFSEEDGKLNPGRIPDVYSALSDRRTKHRAGDDAADLAQAWLAGCR